MKKYTVKIIGQEPFTSTIRNSRRHLIERGGNDCKIYYKGYLISHAQRSGSGRVYNCYIVPGTKEED
jgi:hypothetical protein